MGQNTVLVIVITFVIGNVLAVDEHWWQHANFYQIYPRSFKDSDGDGVGDLRGIMEKVSYLKKDLGLDAIWLSPIFKSPMADFGYDISNFTDIHYEFGTIDDLENLAQECKEQNLKLILDFVPNHSSDEHPYFIKSEKREAGYEDYYVWHPGKNVSGKLEPPSNWISQFRGNAWQWSTVRNEYYLHQFVAKQPDLNYRSAKVVEDMKNVLKFWLDRGVSGFRVDALPFLYESEMVDGVYPDEPKSNKTDDPDNPAYLLHTHTQNLDETFNMVYEWRKVLDEYKASHNQSEDLILMIEAYTPLENIIRLYGNNEVRGAQIPFNFEVLSNIFKESTAKDFYTYVMRFYEALPADQFANWVLGNHDNKRVASRLGVSRADLYTIALNTLPGIAVTYNGDELAMEDVYIPWEDTVDPAACNSNPRDFMLYTRDPVRTPFQWDDSVSAGFSSNPKTWLPVSPYYKQNNYKLQKSAPRSHVKIFKSLLRLRKQRTLKEGSFNIKLVDENLLVYKRELVGSSTIVVVLNFHKSARTVKLSEVFNDLPLEFEIITSSLQTNYIDGSVLDRDQIVLPADAGIVLEGNVKFGV